MTIVLERPEEAGKSGEGHAPLEQGVHQRALEAHALKSDEQRLADDLPREEMGRVELDGPRGAIRPFESELGEQNPFVGPEVRVSDGVAPMWVGQ
jgi:hypothetical protein